MDGRSAIILLPPWDDMTGRGADAQLPTLASRRGPVPVKKAPLDDGAESNGILGRGSVQATHSRSSAKASELGAAVFPFHKTAERSAALRLFRAIRLLANP